MAGLILTDWTATITFLGINENREATLRNISLPEVEVTFAGFAGESRAGLTRPSCSRVAHLYPRGTEIRNARQVTILSAEELSAIAAEMGVDAFDPAWISSGIVVEGLPDLTHVPPGSRLQAENGTTLTVDVENGPCHLPAKVIDEDRPGKGREFRAAAKDRRGVLAWVERPGRLKLGDRLKLFVPDQRPWAP